MSASKFIRFVITLAAFFIFAYLASRRDTVGRFSAPLKLSSKDATGLPLRPTGQIKDLRELALELPDSLLPFCRGVSSKKEIALSFDACPTSGKNHFDTEVFKTLQQTYTPATVFLSGLWVERDSGATRLLASDSLIELANHSFSHPHLITLKDDRVRKELERTQTIISDLTGQRPLLFRAPYGEYNDTLINIARRAGLITVQFDVESGDPDSSFTAERLINWVTKEARNGSVIIMHINNRGRHTAEALPTIIADLRAKGFQLVKVSDLLRQVVE